MPTCGGQQGLHQRNNTASLSVKVGRGSGTGHGGIGTEGESCRRVPFSENSTLTADLPRRCNIQPRTTWQCDYFRDVTITDLSTRLHPTSRNPLFLLRDGWSVKVKGPHRSMSLLRAASGKTPRCAAIGIFTNARPKDQNNGVGTKAVSHHSPRARKHRRRVGKSVLHLFERAERLVDDAGQAALLREDITFADTRE